MTRPAGFFWRYTFREVRRRPLRSLLTLAGIVLGVAAVAAVSLASEATRAGYAGMYRVVAGRASLEVVRAGGHGTFALTPDAVTSIPGVAAAVPLVQAPAALRAAGGPVSVFVLGVDPAADRDVRDYRLVAGDWLQADGVLLEEAFARRHGWAVGSSVDLLTGKGSHAIAVVGLLAADGPTRFNGGAVAVLPLRQAQRYFTADGEVTSLQLVLTRGADRAAIQAAVERAHPSLTVRDPGDRGQLAYDFLRSIEQALGSLSAIAFVSGALVILNTFLMSLTERQRQLALLRALGATRGQILGLLLRQALLLGGLGTVLGLALGVGLAFLLVRVNESFLVVRLPPIRLDPGTLALAAGLGLGMTLLATWLPARRAAERHPLPRLRQRQDVEQTPVSRLPVVLGLLLAAGVVAFLIAVVNRWLPATVATQVLPLFAGSGFLACALVLPAVVPALLRVASGVIPPLLGVEGRLAVRQLSRQRARTSLTVGVIFSAIAGGIAFGLSFRNNLRDIDVWFTHTIDADYLLRAVEPDPAVVITPSELPADAAAVVGGMPGCAEAMPFRFDPTVLRGVQAMVISRQFSTTRPLPMHLPHEDNAAILAALKRGEAVVGSTLAHRLRLSVGDTLNITGVAGPVPVRVAAVIKEYTVGGMALYLDWDVGRRLFGFAAAHGLAVSARPGEEMALLEGLVPYTRWHGLFLQHTSDFANVIQRVVTGVRLLMTSMIALVWLVAVLGVVNTLTTNVLDQTRELGVLRALGLRRRQLRKLIVAQALTLVLVSVLPGVPGGVLLAYLMNVATPGLLGHDVPFRVEWWFVAAAAGGVAVVTTLAALAPAERAAKLAVIDALRYE